MKAGRLYAALLYSKNAMTEVERKAKNAAYMREWNAKNPDKVKARRVGKIAA